MSAGGLRSTRRNAGGSARFTKPIKVKLRGGKSFGKYTDGETMDFTGLSVQQAFEDAAIERFPATVAMNTFSTREVGTTATITVSGAIDLNDATEIIAIRLLKDGTPFATLSPGLSYSQADTVSQATTYRIEADVKYSDETDTISTNRSVPYSYRHFFGATSIQPPNGVQARTLPQLAFATAGNNLTLNTGTTEKIFAVVLAPGKSIASVIDQDALNLNITSEYVLVNNNFTGKDAGGNDVPGCKLYVKTQAVPYTTNHRHNITLV